MASIVSYFSSEVCRGVWKPVSMNGTDWPSPDANLSDVEEQIKKVVAATGVDVPSIASGSFYHNIHMHILVFVVVCNDQSRTSAHIFSSLTYK